MAKYIGFGGYIGFYWKLKNMKMAERAGFEPAIRCYPYDDLANRCLQPLGHRSVATGIATTPLALQALSDNLLVWPDPSIKTA